MRTARIEDRILEKIDETIVKREDRISEKIDETIVRTEDRILEKIDETIVRTEDRASEKIDEIIVRVVISAVVGTGVAEVVVEGNRIYILVTQKSSNTQLSRSLWSKSLLFLANNLTDIMVSFFKKIYIPL